MIELKGAWKGERKEKRGKEERGDRGRNKGEGEGRKKKREEKKGERTEKNKENEKGQQRLLNPPWSSGNFFFFAKNTWNKYPDSSEVKCHRRTNFLVLITKSIAFPDGSFYFCRETKKLLPGVFSFPQPPVCCVLP